MPDTIDALIRLHAADRGSKPMVIDPEQRMSYAELDTGTRQLAAALFAAGVGKGTRVG
ncbi:AMP-binding protein, partial [Mycolicibacterium elephantis]